MNVWYAIPTCNPERALTACQRWDSMGYKVAIGVDAGTRKSFSHVPCNGIYTFDPYPGWCASVDIMARDLVQRYDAHIVVTGGDDIDPDPVQSAEFIGRRFLQVFPDLYGVVQPTGDDLDGTDRICGSPWMGRAWILEAYKGVGPLWPGYRQYYGDEELQVVASAQKAFAQFGDVTQHHHHWMRLGGGMKTDYQRRNDDTFMGPDGTLFQKRKAAGFPCSERVRWG